MFAVVPTGRTPVEKPIRNIDLPVVELEDLVTGLVEPGPEEIGDIR